MTEPNPEQPTTSGVPTPPPAAAPPYPAPPAAAPPYSAPPASAPPYPAPPASAPPYPAPAQYPPHYPAQVFPPQPYPEGPDAAPAGYPPAPPPRKRRTGLIIGLVVAALALLCAGGGTAAYIVVQNAQPKGQAAPADSIEGFLTAVFKEHSASGAAGYVCSGARDEAELERLVAQVETFADQYEGPQTSWRYPAIQPSGQQAEVAVTLTMKTDYEQVATKEIRMILVDDGGWFVCDIEAAG